MPPPPTPLFFLITNLKMCVFKHTYRRWRCGQLTECFFSPFIFSVPPPGGQSFFSRKDSIRTTYTSLFNELRKVATGGRHNQPGSASYLEDLLSHLSEQLCHFTQARMEMADLYEKMHALASQKSIASEELVAPLEAVLHKYSSK